MPELVRRNATVREALGDAIAHLTAGAIAGARLDAEFLLADLLRTDRLRLRIDADRRLTIVEVRYYARRIERRARGEPTAHIVGWKEFYSLRFRVSPAVLIPRPETEHIVDFVLREVRPPPGARVLDLCTGSGCIGLTVLRHIENCELVLTDLSEEALKVARENLGLIAPELSDRCHFYQGDLFDALPDAATGLDSLSGFDQKPFDLILSNPPYIGLDEAAGLEREVRDFEPHQALFADDPVALYARLLDGAVKRLRPGGRIALELGPRWAPAILKLATERFDAAELRQDYSGNDRILIATGR